MNDGFITALNTQRATANWIDALAQNMTNIYTPGYRENQFRFHTFLNGGYVDEFGRKNDMQICCGQNLSRRQTKSR